MNTLKRTSLMALAKIVNAYLQQDPATATRISALNNKTLKLCIMPMQVYLILQIEQNKLQVSSASSADPADVVIRGSITQLSMMMLAKKDRQQFLSDGVQLEGDLAVATAFLNLFDELNIDWEEILSRYVGDALAYHMHQGVRQIWQWATRAEQSFSQELNEYIHEEINLFPSREALEDFFSDVDLLRADLDRLAARVAQCELSLSHDKDKL